MSSVRTTAASSACWSEAMPNASCDLCLHEGGEPIVRQDKLRVVRVVDDAFPAFYRVIWNAHVAELSELVASDRQSCMDAVVTVEQVLRVQLRPTKINLASFGNVVPHLHWHVIARFDWDSHYPQPIWGVAQRAVEPSARSRLPVSLDRLDFAVRSAFG